MTKHTLSPSLPRTDHVRTGAPLTPSTIFFFFSSSLLLSSSTRRGFLPSAIFWTSRGDRCRPFFPPGTCLQFLSRIGFSFSTVLLVDFHRMLLTHALALSAKQFFMQEKVPTSMCTVRIKLAKLILVGTRITYQATGDAGYWVWSNSNTHGQQQ